MIPRSHFLMLFLCKDAEYIIFSESDALHILEYRHNAKSIRSSPLIIYSALSLTIFSHSQRHSINYFAGEVRAHFPTGQGISRRLLREAKDVVAAVFELG